MTSLRARAAMALWRVTGARKDAATEGEVLRRVAAARGRPPTMAGRRLTARFAISCAHQEGFQLYTIAARGDALIPGEIIYVHGGAFLYDIDRLHWLMVTDMAGRTGMTVRLPRYPLAPEHEAPAALSFLMKIYRGILEATPASQVVVMGDSAGAYLAASLVRSALDQGWPAPAGLVSICPWLDLGVRNPEQLAIERTDPMLTVAGLRTAARLYLGADGGQPAQLNHLVAPLDGFPPILMFGAEHDVLVTDARSFAERSAELPWFEYVEGRGLPHVWPNRSFPESRRARERIASFALRVTSG